MEAKRKSAPTFPNEWRDRDQQDVRYREESGNRPILLRSSPELLTVYGEADRQKRHQEGFLTRLPQQPSKRLITSQKTPS
jgi:hypothetical protein